MNVAEFMTFALHDPAGGYYAQRPRIGAGGDFITAPEVSQMFGELIGLWVVETWRRMGSPEAIALVELGPGRGLLMRDILRASSADAAFRRARQVHLLESSPPLRALQAQELAPDTPRWITELEELPEGLPLIVVANEFLDCFPIRQFVRREEGWSERVICENPHGELAFGVTPTTSLLIPEALRDAPLGAVVETADAQARVAADVAGRIARGVGGAALFIDYGRDAFELGDTLQALRDHQSVDPLADPGFADVTAHVDFLGCARAGTKEGALAAPIVSQGAFLVNLGLDFRTAALVRHRPDLQETIERQRRRLAHPDMMGRLFKVLCLHAKGLEPPGFETARPPMGDLDAAGAAL
jgi:SAM-dependent MidA family methyltransferase